MNRNQRVRRNCARVIERAKQCISQRNPVAARRLLNAAKHSMDGDYVIAADSRIHRAYSKATEQLKSCFPSCLSTSPTVPAEQQQCADGPLRSLFYVCGEYGLTFCRRVLGVL
jgi:hypothetical protein